MTLFDPRTGVPIAIVDGTEITERRTGALTALGGRELGKHGSGVLAHLGARGTAFSNVTMLDRVFDFAEIRVTSKRVDSRRAFGTELERALGKPVRVLETIEETVVGADIVVEATRLERPAPILRTVWLEQCTLLIPYGTMSVLELDVLDALRQGRRRRLGAMWPGRSIRRPPAAGQGRTAHGRVAARRARPDRGRPAPWAGRRRRADPVLASRSRDDGCRSRVARGRARPHRGHRDVLRYRS